MGVSLKHTHSMSFSDFDKRYEEDTLNTCHETSHHLNKKGEGEVKCWIKPEKKQSTNTVLHGSMKQEILHLETRLQDQFVERKALEKALGSFSDISNNTSIPKPAKELIREIAELEVEVVYLEQYLLSLYRKAFDQKESSASPSRKDERLESPSIIAGIDARSKRKHSVVQASQLLVHRDSLSNEHKELNDIEATEKLLDSGIHRSQSSLSQRSTYSTGISTPMGNLANELRLCHSQPLSFLQHGQIATSNVVSLADHLGTRIADHIPQTPNKISEDMIKCMSSIYCKLSDPPLMHHGFSSPSSSISSVSELSPQEQYDMWNTWGRNESSFDRRFDNHFHIDESKEFSGPYNTMLEVPSICRDSKMLNEIDDMLQNYRSLVCQLEEVTPRKMKHEEKLAFWINIHNALVMHALLVYGIPQNNVKRTSLLLKAAYNVGGRTISTETIQSSILGCRMPRPVKWLRILFSPRTKFKVGDERRLYAIVHPEPLLHFALCSGSHSDPAIRIYTPKRVHQELAVAKEEYIRASFVVVKEQKFLLPKIVESFAKDSGLHRVDVVEMIQQFVPKTLGKKMQRSIQGKTGKIIEWVPHNFAFRYLIPKELVK